MRPDQIIVALAVGPQAYYVCSVLSWGREKKKRERDGCDRSCPSRVFVSGRVAIGSLAPVCLPLSQSRHDVHTAGWLGEESDPSVLSCFMWDQKQILSFYVYCHWAWFVMW